ncbi:hypothetical protein VFPFJ_03574 [Purpureocillium lilacinum]|uniref:Uncharacterized protein n=1 Tax=Purpureocillium lilacinum TaxID=33203 RepID=A0A179HPC8_PURLI|nr:hypothetical protein VFPFJ_03574 [Purpureocillium lilacinum]OAQ81785.1 hypothetical protein VFPBJ_04369 [Purpureocillium lilacinum]OAQ91834.1 hypothetical protein VFPFJ_03574 [Purpureocillium lilacinum]
MSGWVDGGAMDRDSRAPGVITSVCAAAVCRGAICLLPYCAGSPFEFPPVPIHHGAVARPHCLFSLPHVLLSRNWQPNCRWSVCCCRQGRLGPPAAAPCRCRCGCR